MAIMNKFFTALLLCMSVGTTMLAQQTNSYKISESDIHVGYFVKKVWLNNYEVPQVSISSVSYTEGVALPDNALPSHPENFEIILGKERKRPFALIRVPAYSHIRWKEIIVNFI